MGLSCLNAGVQEQDEEDAILTDDGANVGDEVVDSDDDTKSDEDDV